MESKPQRVWVTHPTSHSQDGAKIKYLHMSAECRPGVLFFLLDILKVTSSFYLTTQDEVQNSSEKA